MKIVLPTLSLFVALVICSCAEKPSKSPDEEFWAWFTPNAEKFSKIYSSESLAKESGEPDQTPSGKTMNLISAKLGKVNPAFSPFLGGDKDDTKRNFIVTVFGNADLFDEVDAFVNNAPKSDYWNFIALKPRTMVDAKTIIKTGDSTIPLNAARFTYTKNAQGHFDVVVYLHDEIDSDTPRADGFARAISVDMMGERVAGKALGEISVKKLTEVPEDAHPFLEIGDRLEALLASPVVTE